MNALVEQFLAGNLAIFTNICMLPLYPGLIAFLAGNANNERAKRSPVLLGGLVLAGILTLMLVLGLVIYWVESEFSYALPTLLPMIYGLVIGMGVLLLLGFNPFSRMARPDAPQTGNPYLTAFMYGLLLAPMTLPCTGPVIISAFLIGAADFGGLAVELLGVLAFGLGFGWPLLVLPLLAIPIQRRLTGWLAKHHALITRIAGIILIAIGIFGFITVVLPETQGIL
ncbi:MAG: hypothetical protein OHK0023_00730 [Anaerolineae bacterium]